MLKILSISNFKHIPIAFILAFIGILFVEYYGYLNFRGKYFNHEVDYALHQIENKKFNANYLLLGDSVGGQILYQFQEDPQFAWLATNQAIETTGQLFLTQRYLQNNSPPKAVIFSALPFLSNQNLNQKYTENFVFRTFTKFSEIWSIFLVKLDPAILVKMITYKYLQTYKYRLKLQHSIIGFSNSDVYTGVDSAANQAKLGEYSLLRILKRRLPKETTSDAHFEQLLGYLQNKGIEFYYIPAPVKKVSTPKKSWHLIHHQQLITNKLPPLRDKYSIFHYFSELVEHDPTLFRDHVHYSPKGLPTGEMYIRDKVDLILMRM